MLKNYIHSLHCLRRNSTEPVESKTQVRSNFSDTANTIISTYERGFPEEPSFKTQERRGRVSI